MASQIAALGTSPAEAVAGPMGRPDLGTLPLQLVLIASSLSQAGQSHLAFPMLQFFHSAQKSSSIPANVARYDEILSVLEHALPDDHTATVRTGRQAVEDFIDTLHLTERVPPPPAPSLAAVRARRDEVLDNEAFSERLTGSADRRARLRAFVEAEAWTWEDVDPGGGR